MHHFQMESTRQMKNSLNRGKTLQTDEGMPKKGVTELAWQHVLQEVAGRVCPC